MLQSKVNFFVSLFMLLFFYTHAQSHKEKGFFIDVNVNATHRIEGEQTASQFQRKITQTVTNGIQYGITGYYQTPFLKNTSLGLKYLLNKNHGEENTSLYIIDGQLEEGNLQNSSQLHYIGASAMSSFLFGDDKNEAFFEPSVGYFYYHQEIEIDTKQTLKGGNIGFSATFGYLRHIGSNFCIGLNLGYLNANLETYKLKNNNGERKIEASRNAALVLGSFHGGFLMRYKI
ncbi:hypothetical protein [Ochrovirga pacifica]|uniref:hypothetical protein n=1 Tax=Ochrovirga pacifica TaxID=1042376 RepID=UPI0002559DAE|nr:hypothetical protein [Ochrovirga pacifica]